MPVVAMGDGIQHRLLQITVKIRLDVIAQGGFSVEARGSQVRKPPRLSRRTVDWTRNYRVPRASGVTYVLNTGPGLSRLRSG